MPKLNDETAKPLAKVEFLFQIRQAKTLGRLKNLPQAFGWCRSLSLISEDKTLSIAQNLGSYAQDFR